MTVAPHPEIVIVVAAAENGAIGLDGNIPWHLPDDLRRFRSITMGKAIVMGRKTYESIGKPLPGRHNIVLTQSAGWSADGVSIAGDLATALQLAASSPAGDHSQIMIIGGADIYELARPMAHRIELTRVHMTPDADRFFQTPDPSVWHQISSEHHEARSGQPAYSFLSFVRGSG